MRFWRLGLSALGFLVVCVLCQSYLFIGLGEFALGPAGGYTIFADFTKASGLEPGSLVEVAGVQVGQVTGIQLVGARARVRLTLRDEVQLQDDAIASIQTKGLLGGQYLLISPGASDDMIAPGGKIRDTESPLDLPGLMSAYIALREKKAASQSAAGTP
jgi:phospholipid/cholesterol/gamma-HCH transport system substrate-binding protein